MIYSKAVRLCHEALLAADAARRARVAASDKSSDRGIAVARMSEALASARRSHEALNEAASEVSIIGSPEFGAILLRFASTCSAYTTGVHDRMPAARLPSELTNLLYTDVRKEFAWDDSAEMLRLRAIEILDQHDPDASTDETHSD
ncbi:hypothetical protein AB0M46_26555 [Dactylosporangium sp. NPDC051485]|uniref:hypothetical protein n=1 Tax=Dactylosporangium sp. NPDC051485 TaxID=3154846 RepID=UPI0034327E87